jgi:hypothetical protein
MNFVDLPHLFMESTVIPNANPYLINTNANFADLGADIHNMILGRLKKDISKSFFNERWVWRALPKKYVRECEGLFIKQTLIFERTIEEIEDTLAPLLNVIFIESVDPEAIHEIRSASELDLLSAQMDSRHCWEKVRKIRLQLVHEEHIRPPDPDDPDPDDPDKFSPPAYEYIFHFVCTDKHGDKLMSAPRSFALTTREKRSLAKHLIEKVGLQHSRVAGVDEFSVHSPPPV